MNEQACHLVDRVLPRAPYRQWVLTLPSDLARAVAYEPRLCSQVFGLFAEEVARWQRQRGAAKGVASPHAGSVMEIQRFADSALLWPHGHLLAPDGVFSKARDGGVRFFGIGPPSDKDVQLVLERTVMRVRRVLERRMQAADHHGELGCSGDRQLELGSTAPADSVFVADRERGLGGGARPPRTRRRKKRCARSSEGFELHADVQVAAGDRAGLERLCRYLMRPALAEDRLVRRDDGRIEFQLKRTWKGGVRALIFEPTALIARMAALLPLPRTKLTRFFGVFSAAHALRALVVAQPPDPARVGHPVAPSRPARMSWADLLQRVWGLDALRCPFCDGRMYLVSVVRDPDAVTAILAAIHVWSDMALGRATSPRGPPRQGLNIA